MRKLLIMLFLVSVLGCYDPKQYQFRIETIQVTRILETENMISIGYNLREKGQYGTINMDKEIVPKIGDFYTVKMYPQYSGASYLYGRLIKKVEGFSNE